MDVTKVISVVATVDFANEDESLVSSRQYRLDPTDPRLKAMIDEALAADAPSDAQTRAIPKASKRGS